MSCLANDVLIVSPGGRHASRKVHSLTLANGPINITDELTLDLSPMYEIIQTDEPGKGPYKVSTRAYDYAVRDGGGRVQASYHWHPLGRSSYTDPHFHVPLQWPGVHLLRPTRGRPGQISSDLALRVSEPPVGIEPTTYALRVRRSGRLS